MCPRGPSCLHLSEKFCVCVEPESGKIEAVLGQPRPLNTDEDIYKSREAAKKNATNKCPH